VGIIAAASTQALLLTADAPALTGSGIDPWLPFINFGVIGALVVLIVTKTGFVPKWVLDSYEKDSTKALADREAAHLREIDLLQEQIEQLKRDKSELKATNDQLTKVAQEQFLPALIESNRLTALYVETLARRGPG
jgi:hypothetical protein